MNRRWPSARWGRLFAAMMWAGAGLFGPISGWAQQPPPGRPAPNQALPPGHPPVQLPPGFRPPSQQFPARPVPPRRPLTPVVPPAKAGDSHPASGDAHHGGAHACPSHGPNDPPHHINYWQGLLGVNNDRAQKGGFVDKLLWRYENEQDPCDEHNQPPPLLASVINFGLLAYILYRFGRKPLSDALAKRKHSIMGEIDNATRLKHEAQERLGEYEERFEHIEETLAALTAEHAAQSAQEKKLILAEAEERRARMRRDAQFRVEQELKAAKNQLLEETVDEAIAAAEELIRKRVSEQDVERMADDYLRTVNVALSAAAGEALGATAASAGGRS